MSREICPVCSSNLKEGLQQWHQSCTGCDYEKAMFKPAINLHAEHYRVDEVGRESGLKQLRINNFKLIHREIIQLKGAGGRLLDVGCAHGWYLNIAKNDFEVTGLEPDKTIYDLAAKLGLPVRNGYFPDILTADEKFDVIIFNDVIEHIPNINATLDHCRSRLNNGGLLVLNLPSNQGIFYKTSKLLCRFGLTSFFDRMWQKGLPSPHLHYFSQSSLLTILRKHNFSVRGSGNLPSLQASGLYTRITHTGSHNLVSKLLLYALVSLSLPFLSLLPKDIIYVAAIKESA